MLFSKRFAIILAALAASLAALGLGLRLMGSSEGRSGEYAGIWRNGAGEELTIAADGSYEGPESLGKQGPYAEGSEGVTLKPEGQKLVLSLASIGDKTCLLYDSGDAVIAFVRCEPAEEGPAEEGSEEAPAEQAIYKKRTYEEEFEIVCRSALSQYLAIGEWSGCGGILKLQFDKTHLTFTGVGLDKKAFAQKHAFELSEIDATMDGKYMMAHIQIEGVGEGELTLTILGGGKYELECSAFPLEREYEKTAKIQLTEPDGW